MKMLGPALEKWEELTRAGKSSVLVTLVKIRGSAPQVVGGKMTVSEAGLEAGTIGGGKIEAHSILFAQKVLTERSGPTLETWNLQTDIGMSCGGEVTLFFEPMYLNLARIAIFGAGHVSQELCRILSHGNFWVDVFDSRAEWVNRLPEGGRIRKKLSPEMKSEVASLREGTVLLCMTQGHAFDVPILNEALKTEEKFQMIGVIGSEVKALKIRSELKVMGHSEEKCQKIVCPIGLAIGDSTPSEIAISIAAQLLALRDGLRVTVEEMERTAR